MITQALRERLMAEGSSPLEFLLTIMRDSEQPLNVRLEAAKTAIGFLHPKLQSINYVGKGEDATPRVIEIVFVKPNSVPQNDLPAPEGENAAPIAIHQEHKAMTFLPERE